MIADLAGPLLFGAAFTAFVLILLAVAIKRGVPAGRGKNDSVNPSKGNGQA